MTVGHGACHTAFQWKIRAEHPADWDMVMNTRGARAYISSAPLLKTEGVEAQTSESLIISRKEQSLMSSSTLLRWSGLAALVGYALLAVLDPILSFVFPDDVATSVMAASNAWFVLRLLEIIASLLGLVGLVGLYAHQAEKVGILGLIAFLMAFTGSALGYAWTWMETFVWPVLAHAAPRLLDHPEPVSYQALQVLTTSDTIGFLLAVVGVLLFAVVSLRARALPRWAAVLVIVGAVWGFVLGSGFVGVEVPFGQTLGGLGLAWMGYAVWSHKGATPEAIAPIPKGGPSLASR